MSQRAPHPGHLRSLGVYGYDKVEPVILASLVTEDPLLLVGKAGTGKTFLLNSLSEAFGLEHRHYNASLISFDDLVGFPYPEANASAIRYLETPATIWKAETVLFDEISRCKPEHQNRLFSVILERRIQGIALDRLRFRWAAMNPTCGEAAAGDADSLDETYRGSEPLDQALADRFAFVVKVPDWHELAEADQRLVLDPAGEGAVSRDLTGLRLAVEAARGRFQRFLQAPPPWIAEYLRTLASTLWEAHLRISPRRVRQWARNLLALAALDYPLSEDETCELALRCGVPHEAAGHRVDAALLHAAHKSAFIATRGKPAERWLQEFHALGSPSAKLAKLVEGGADEHTAGTAVVEYLSRGDATDTAAFASALFPHVLGDGLVRLPLEAVHDLGKVAGPLLHVQAERTWRDNDGKLGPKADAVHPEYGHLIIHLENLGPARRRLCEPLALSLFAAKTPFRKILEVVAEHGRCLDALERLLSPAGTRAPSRPRYDRPTKKETRHGPPS